MKRWLGPVRWFALVALTVQAIGQQAIQAKPHVQSMIVADESSARAVLTQDSVRLHLPLRSTPTGVLRASAWLLSPDNTASKAVTSDLPSGSRAVDLELPLPRDKSGAVESGIGWYRIAYRLV